MQKKKEFQHSNTVDGDLSVVKVGDVMKNDSGHFVFKPSIPEEELWPGKELST